MKIWSQIDGWFDYADFEFYTLIARSMSDSFTMLEIGSYKGRSTACMSEICKALDKKVDIDVIDTFKGDKHIGEQNTFSAFMDNISTYGTVRTIYALDSAVAYQKIEANTYYDFIFIDASHDAESVTRDILTYKPFLAPNGIIGGHDYKHYGVREGVENALGTSYSTIGNCWYK